MKYYFYSGNDWEKEYEIDPNNPINADTEIFFYFQWTIWGNPETLVNPYYINVTLDGPGGFAFEELIEDPAYREAGYIITVYLHDEEGNGWFASNGDHTLTYIVDSQDDIIEWDENNNEKSISFSVVGPFYFVHITDPHVIAFGTDRWDAVRNEILSWPDKPEFVLCSGDLVDWGADVTGAANFVAFIWSLHTPFPYEWYLDSEHEIPVCFCPGNHDSRFIYQLAPPYSLINYRAIVSPLTCYSTKIGNCAIFSMNSGSDYWPWGGFPWPNPFPWDAPGDIMLPEGEGLYSLDVLTLIYNLDSLDGSIDSMDTSDYVKIIMLHHPHVNPNATSGDSEDGVFWNFRDEFKQICNQFGVHLVLCGHLHGKISGGRVWDLNGGYWSPEDGTKCIVTAAVKDYAHRNISIDLIPTLTGNEYEIIEGDMEYVKSTINLDIRGRVDSYVYDDKGNYAGLNETGDGIDLEIPGSFYSRWIFDNETLGINETYIEISVDREHSSGRDDSSDYMFVIEGLADDTMNLTVEVHLKDDNSSKAIYENVTLFNGSVPE